MGDRSYLLGLPDDVSLHLLRCLKADSCGALRATSMSVGCHLVNEDFFTGRLDAAIRTNGLNSVLSYRKRHKTAQASLKAACRGLSTAIGHLGSLAAMIIGFSTASAILFAVLLFPLQWLIQKILAVRISGSATFSEWFPLFLIGAYLNAFKAEWARRDVVKMREMMMCFGDVFVWVARLVWGGLRLAIGIDKRMSQIEYLMRLLYVIEEGGCWEPIVPLIHFVRNCGMMPSLPIVVTADDLKAVGSRAVFDARPGAVRQYSLFSRRLVYTLRVGRVDNQDCLGSSSQPMTYQTPGVLPSAAFDPPTTCGNRALSSFTDLIVHSAYHDRYDGRVIARHLDERVFTTIDAGQQLAAQVAAQPGPPGGAIARRLTSVKRSLLN
ncbi:unnamed protein product [Vitrella brassicaformis CCMP3155]|uniref:Uncharacterized protein n=1 Tax=Vitrella brassicaformis (strain CCMP3155) TaxID=1169540 RepID=A0A0G4EH99_VITBC|nr:unnamed protein product [Vitrella brassicaformis CCMP3155]|eukprot:CEL94759.1 unnamed protein product [Vitrella brassicaformis CCMP3155]